MSSYLPKKEIKKGKETSGDLYYSIQLPWSGKTGLLPARRMIGLLDTGKGTPIIGVGQHTRLKNEFGCHILGPESRIAC